MRTRFILIIALLIIFSCILNSQEKKTLIEEVNKKVELIEKNIEEYDYIYLEYLPAAEGLLGLDTKFYYEENGQYILRLAKISIRHEIWRNEFFYYFDEDGKILKFINKAVGRPDNPPKRAIIFDRQGKIIWRNFHYKIPMSPEEVKKYFSQFKKQMEDLIDKHNYYKFPER